MQLKIYNLHIPKIGIIYFYFEHFKRFQIDSQIIFLLNIDIVDKFMIVLFEPYWRNVQIIPFYYR